MDLRKAIITGSTKYQNSPLQFPIKDVDLISTVLEKRCHFESTSIFRLIHAERNPDNSFLEKIKDVCDKLNHEKTNSYDLILFYFSGHGIYKPIEKMSFLQISDEHFIPIDEIINIICEVKAKNKYFIIDACQSGGFTLMTPKGKITRQYTYNSEGVYCMFGTTKNQLAFEPTTKDIIRKRVNHSFYTHFIAEALNTKSNYTDNTVSIKVIDDYATKKTPTYTNFEQIPYTTTQTSGYFPLGFWDDLEEFTDISHWNMIESLMSQTTSYHEIDAVNHLEYKIQRLYSNQKEFFLLSDTELLRNLSQPALDLLNEKLSLSTKKYNEQPLINGLISDQSQDKQSFLIFLLEQSQIEIDLTLKGNKNTTALFEAIHSIHYTRYIIELLFMRGYKVNSVEESFLYSEFQKTNLRPEVLENLAIAIVCHKLNDVELIKRLRRIEGIIFSLISFKINRVIGYKLNTTALANNFLHNHKYFSTIFLRALKEFGAYEKLKSKDSFARKEAAILEEMPFQETSYDDILEIIFPEIFNIK